MPDRSGTVQLASQTGVITASGGGAAASETSAIEPAARAQRPRRPQRLTGRPALYLLASLIVSLLAVSPGLGTGTGSLLSALAVRYLPAPTHQVSLLFVVSYLGLGIPAVAAGFAATRGLGLLGAARYYGIAVIAAAALALIGILRDRPAKKVITWL
jgi:hypothetical protein